MRIKQSKMFVCVICVCMMFGFSNARAFPSLNRRATRETRNTEPSENSDMGKISFFHSGETTSKGTSLHGFSHVMPDQSLISKTAHLVQQNGKAVSNTIHVDNIDKETSQAMPLQRNNLFKPEKLSDKSRGGTSSFVSMFKPTNENEFAIPSSSNFVGQNPFTGIQTEIESLDDPTNPGNDNPFAILDTGNSKPKEPLNSLPSAVTRDQVSDASNTAMNFNYLSSQITASSELTRDTKDTSVNVPLNTLYSFGSVGRNSLNAANTGKSATPTERIDAAVSTGNAANNFDYLGSLTANGISKVNEATKDAPETSGMNTLYAFGNTENTNTDAAMISDQTSNESSKGTRPQNVPSGTNFNYLGSNFLTGTHGSVTNIANTNSNNLYDFGVNSASSETSNTNVISKSSIESGGKPNVMNIANINDRQSNLENAEDFNFSDLGISTDNVDFPTDQFPTPNPSKFTNKPPAPQNGSNSFRRTPFMTVNSEFKPKKNKTIEAEAISNDITANSRKPMMVVAKSFEDHSKGPYLKVHSPFVDLSNKKTDNNKESADAITDKEEKTPRFTTTTLDLVNVSPSPMEKTQIVKDSVSREGNNVIGIELSGTQVPQTIDNTLSVPDNVMDNVNLKVDLLYPSAPFPKNPQVQKVTDPFGNIDSQLNVRAPVTKPPLLGNSKARFVEKSIENKNAPINDNSGVTVNTDKTQNMDKTKLAAALKPNDPVNVDRDIIDAIKADIPHRHSVSPGSSSLLGKGTGDHFITEPDIQILLPGGNNIGIGVSSIQANDKMNEANGQRTIGQSSSSSKPGMNMNNNLTNIGDIKTNDELNAVLANVPGEQIVNALPVNNRQGNTMNSGLRVTSTSNNVNFGFVSNNLPNQNVGDGANNNANSQGGFVSDNGSGSQTTNAVSGGIQGKASPANDLQGQVINSIQGIDGFLNARNDLLNNGNSINSQTINAVRPSGIGNIVPGQNIGLTTIQNQDDNINTATVNQGTEGNFLDGHGNPINSNSLPTNAETFDNWNNPNQNKGIKNNVINSTHTQQSNAGIISGVNGDSGQIASVQNNQMQDNNIVNLNQPQGFVSNNRNTASLPQNNVPVTSWNGQVHSTGSNSVEPVQNNQVNNVAVNGVNKLVPQNQFNQMGSPTNNGQSNVMTDGMMTLQSNQNNMQIGLTDNQRSVSNMINNQMISNNQVTNGIPSTSFSNMQNKNTRSQTGQVTGQQLQNLASQSTSQMTGQTVQNLGGLATGQVNGQQLQNLGSQTVNQINGQMHNNGQIARNFPNEIQNQFGRQINEQIQTNGHMTGNFQNELQNQFGRQIIGQVPGQMQSNVQMNGNFQNTFQNRFGLQNTPFTNQGSMANGFAVNEQGNTAPLGSLSTQQMQQNIVSDQFTVPNGQANVFPNNPIAPQNGQMNSFQNNQFTSQSGQNRNIVASGQFPQHTGQVNNIPNTMNNVNLMRMGQFNSDVRNPFTSSQTTGFQEQQMNMWPSAQGPFQPNNMFSNAHMPWLQIGRANGVPMNGPFVNSQWSSLGTQGMVDNTMFRSFPGLQGPQPVVLPFK